MKRIMILVIFLITTLFGASFDCTKVQTGTIEHKICNNEKLSKLDDELSNIYNSFYFISKEIKSDQIKWIKQRNRCKDNTCIQKAYTTRIEDLNISLSNEKTFPKYVLDAMKEAEVKMQIHWPLPVMFKKEIKQREKSLQFKDKLFRFQNIQFKQPLIQNVKYDNPQLKKLLGVCYDYRFDLEVGEHSKRNTLKGRKYWVEDNRRLLKDINVSVWKTYTEGQEWFFIKPRRYGRAFLVSTILCKQKRLKNNIVDALNYDKKQIRMSQTGLHDAGLVSYKKKEYIFDISWVKNSIIYFTLYKTLGTTTLGDPTINFTGGWVYSVPFALITKSKKEEK